MICGYVVCLNIDDRLTNRISLKHFQTLLININIHSDNAMVSKRFNNSRVYFPYKTNNNSNVLQVPFCSSHTGVPQSVWYVIS